MRTRRAQSVLLLSIAVGLAGCAIFASKSEYAEYRNVRTAPDDQARLLAEHRYIADHPHGTWATEVQAHRQAVELDVWNASKTSREGLQFYLEAFPDAPHVVQARARLAALQSVQGHREDEAARRRAVEEARRQARDEQRRTWATRSITFWAQTLLGIQNWGSPIAQVAGGDPAFSTAFGEAPRPHCNRDECDKFYLNHYAIPVPGATRVERTLGIVLRLKMPGGNVDRAEILMSGKGFSRWYEMENRTIVTDEDPQQRQQAIDWVVAKLGPIVDQLLPGATPINNPTMDAVSPLPFASDGSATGTSTPGSGVTITPEDDEDDEQAQSPDAGAAAAADAGTPAAAAPDAGAPDSGESSFDELMLNAAGGGGQTATPPPEEPTQVVTITPDDAGPLFPRVVKAVSTPAMRVYFFVANDDDYGTAYDGIIIERNRPAAATPAGGHGRPARPARPAPRPRAPRPAAHP